MDFEDVYLVRRDVEGMTENSPRVGGAMFFEMGDASMGFDRTSLLIFVAL